MSDTTFGGPERPERPPVVLDYVGGRFEIGGHQICDPANIRDDVAIEVDPATGTACVTLTVLTDDLTVVDKDGEAHHWGSPV